MASVRRTVAPLDASRRSVTRPLRPVTCDDHPAVARARNNAFVALPPELVPRLDGLVAAS